MSLTGGVGTLRYNPLMNEVVLRKDTLKDIEMFASGIAIGVEMLANENRTFANELDKNSNLLRSLIS